MKKFVLSLVSIILSFSTVIAMEDGFKEECETLHEEPFSDNLFATVQRCWKVKMVMARLKICSTENPQNCNTWELQVPDMDDDVK